MQFHKVCKAKALPRNSCVCTCCIYHYSRTYMPRKLEQIFVDQWVLQVSLKNCTNKGYQLQKQTDPFMGQTIGSRQVFARTLREATETVEPPALLLLGENSSQGSFACVLFFGVRRFLCSYAEAKEPKPFFDPILTFFFKFPFHVPNIPTPPPKHAFRFGSSKDKCLDGDCGVPIW